MIDVLRMRHSNLVLAKSTQGILLFSLLIILSFSSSGYAVSAGTETQTATRLLVENDTQGKIPSYLFDQYDGETLSEQEKALVLGVYGETPSLQTCYSLEQQRLLFEFVLGRLRVEGFLVSAERRSIPEALETQTSLKDWLEYAESGEPFSNWFLAIFFSDIGHKQEALFHLEQLFRSAHDPETVFQHIIEISGTNATNRTAVYSTLYHEYFPDLPKLHPFADFHFVERSEIEQDLFVTRHRIEKLIHAEGLAEKISISDIRL